MEDAKEKYKDLTREDLLEIVEKMESRKKYGLIWDEEKVKEQFEKDSVNALPILKEIKGKEIKTKSDEPINILIEGDNYHALSVLNFTHQGKVDVIYIDPPYNTGNKDFKYNDNFIEKEDSYRHSKWISFMSKRLRLSKNILKDSGVIFISIDDNEQAQLKILCDEIFGQDNFVGTLIWNKKNVVQNDARFFSTNHEYIHCYGKNINNVFFNLVPRTDEQKARYKNPDNDPRGLWTSVALQAKSGSSSNLYEITFENNVKWKPVAGTFPRLSKESLMKAYEEDRLWFGKSGENVPRLKKYLNEVKQGVVSNSILLPYEVGSTQLAKETIKKILNDNIFETPKPVELIKRLIRLNSDKKGLILDFMAGSGTTGHSVLDLNKEDGGKRQFILCTNNELNGLEKELQEKCLSKKEIQEHGICRRVTYPRIEKVIKGYKNSKDEKVEGLGGNLKYFKTGFIKKTINKDDMKIKLTRECTEMLCIREGVFDGKKKSDDYAIFEQGGRIMAVYYSIERKGLKELKKQMDKMKGEKVLYCFTLDPLGLDKTDFSSWKDTQLEPIPQKILEVYEEIYEY